jgi:chromatin remodeling complex protein RSC6
MTDKIPINITKMELSILNIEKLIEIQKRDFKNTELEFNKLKKITTSITEMMKKKREKKPRKPSGFAIPSLVSSSLCDFLKLPHDSIVSRTYVTQYLIKYIRDNNLVNPNNKTQILPDEKLMLILGNDVDFNNLTRFSIQKYMNMHYL